MKRTLEDYTLQHHTIPLDEELDEDIVVLKDRQYIDMDRIQLAMRQKIVDDRISQGFAIYTTTVDNLLHNNENNVLNKEIQKTKKLIQEDMAPNSGFFRINPREVSLCNFIYQNTASIKDSISHFKTHLFKTPFKVKIALNKDETREMFGFEEDLEIATLNEELEEVIIQNKWVPMLEEHYKWQKLCGVVPVYFEPVGIKLNQVIKIHYIPRIPLIDSGVIYTYLDKNQRQKFVWEWSTSDRMFSEIDGMSNFDTDISELSTQNRKTLLKKSRYMFFDVPEREHAPSLRGILQSDIKSIMNDWLRAVTMTDQIIMATYKAMNPETIVEFSPDMEKIGGNGNIEILRLMIEYMKTKKDQNRGYGGLENYSTLFGDYVQTEPDKPIDALEEFFNQSLTEIQNKTRYDDITKKKESMLSRPESRFAETDLGMEPLIQGAPVRPTSISDQITEKLYVKALNDPGGDLHRAFLNKNARGQKYPQNTSRLEPFEKAIHGPKVETPKFNITEIWNRFDNSASSICDFPLDLIKNTGNISGGPNPKSAETSTAVLTRMDMFKERIKKKAKSYVGFVKQCWIMAYSPFTKRTIQELRLNKIIQTIDPVVLKLFDRVKISIPLMPFLDYSTALKFYQDGFMDIQSLHNFVVEAYCLPQKKMTAAEYKKIEQKLEFEANKQAGLVKPKEVDV